MIELKELLLKFSNLLLSKEIKKETSQKIISEFIKKEIKKEEIEIKNNLIFLKTKPIYKNEVLLKKELILLEINKRLGGGDIRDIK